jgi:alpha-galactosidase
VLADPATGNLRAIAFSNNFADYELAPDECIDTEEILIGAFDDGLSALEDWATFCAARRQIKIWPKQPPVGWLSWYGYRLTQNASDTLRTADLIKDEFAELDFEYIQLDLGYNKGNLPGNWFEENDHYPDGLENLSQKLAGRNFKLGVWICPFLVAADSNFAKDHPEALLPLHPGDPQNWHWEPHCQMYQLDSTHPEGEKFLRRIVKHFKSLGVCYFKFDFCGRMGRVDKKFIPYDHRKIKGVEIYRHGLKVLMEMMEPSDYVYWCSNMLQFGFGFGATSMTAGDIGNTGCSAAREIEGRVENSNHFLRQAVTTISRYYLHKKLYSINPDSLNVAPPADLEECRLRAALVTMSGGQMFLGDRFDLAESDRLDLIRQCVPPYGEAARPVDLFKHVYPENYPHIWHLHVNTRWDEREVISLLNLDAKKVIEVDLANDLMLDANQSYHAWEFWEKQSLGIVSGSLKVEVPAPATRMIVLVAVRRHPWVLSTSFHFTQGGVDLSQVKWDAKSCTLSGWLDRPSGMNGEIYLTAPQGYSCSLAQVADDVFMLPLIGGGKPQKWEVQF